jgi:hypothetical protein
MWNVIGVILLVEGDGHLGPSELGQGGEGVDNIHLLLDDAVLPAGLVRLGALQDHEAAIDLRELAVFLLGIVCRVAILQGRLLGLALLAEVP